MNKILTSMLVISAVVTAGYLGTKAYFSDVEESKGNVLSAGTIDISVDEQNPWTATYTDNLTDMKPGAHAKEIAFTIKNEGQNPVNIWKRVTVTARETGDVSEPECTDQGGSYSGGVCTWGSAGDKNDMDTQIVYSMKVDSTDLIDDAWDVRMSEVDTLWIPLKTLQPDETEQITQYYLLDEMAGNEYQGDKITFDITLYAEQYMGPGPSATSKGLILENKSGDPHWTPVIDGTWGILTWDGTNYKLRAWGLTGGVTYRLAYWNGSAESGVSGYVAPSSGAVSITGPDTLAANPDGAKYWLRPSDWSTSKTLWEANLVNY